ncbi:hypothetical protein HG15A2_03820 [Adhaeretor mobilis]|uniref:Uncharacterized protein n=1 Tax=Adhaeretor mobilis TaxID=1930276 RepID=A0A517MQH3_9BACT|nr:hypothetical protein HG15A2_03820 [Adhaeretor mobilis]
MQNRLASCAPHTDTYPSNPGERATPPTDEVSVLSTIYWGRRPDFAFVLRAIGPLNQNVAWQAVVAWPGNLLFRNDLHALDSLNG